MFTNLDSIDLSILNSLQKNGRITNVELSAIAGISAPPCLRRLKNLEQHRIIAGYHANLNPMALGYSLSAICIVVLDSQRKEAVDNFIDAMKHLKNVRRCCSTPGSMEFILTIVSRSIEEYEKIIENELLNKKNVLSVKTYITTKVYKDEPGIPVELTVS